MDWQALQAEYPRDRDMPARAFTINALTRVLNGEQYDTLQYPFSKERTDGGEYIPLVRRRPSVRSGLCRSVVDDSVSLVFGEEHFPSIVVENDNAKTQLADLIREASLPEIMIDAATRGSVGSVALLFQAIEHRPVFTVMDTANLTPVWQKARPKLLASVTERYKVKGSDLAEQGYKILDADRAASFWFQRIWDDTNETWFLPQSMADAGDRKPMAIDPDRSVEHGLGFVPIVWIRNLPGGDGPDGACSFEAAIDTTIEIDYLLSQGGRGLKYASDPTLVIKQGPMIPGEPARQGGAATALTLPPEGDAKLLEINGAAASAVLEQVRYLRSLAMEAIHGNRADADRLKAAQSGVAQKLMHQSLVWLAGRLRLTYGENGLLTLLRMVCAASEKIDGGLTIGDASGVHIDPSGLELRWPDYFKPTNADLLATAQALVTANAGGLLSQVTAVTLLARIADVDDVGAELLLVQAEAAAKAQQAADAQAAADIRAQANVAKNETRQITA
ncbi:phage portal protein [Acetobacteraceae bacterium KSS8]|uniref:Phage portal protein n=1 Tax=Endosaccharibacter trunci TaxID=2812733 RepID=A0ABT1WAG4_9PROT|nr:phage portal protein [Acetobacteraceae bacterium KSS8]